MKPLGKNNLQVARLGYLIPGLLALAILALLEGGALSLTGLKEPKAFAGEVQSFELQAAFIYQFTNYIEWPESKKQSDSKKPFVILIIGDSPVQSSLERLASVKTIKGRRIQILKEPSTEKIPKSDLVFLATAESSKLEALLKTTSHQATLVICEHAGAAENGAMINFYEEEGRLKYEINRSALEKEKFKVSSQLLKLAKIVEGKGAK